MKKKDLENIVKWIFLLCGIAAVGFVLCICLYLVISGVPAIQAIGLWNFLFGETWNAPTNEFGILPFILTSVYGTAGALLLGVPLGLFTAVFLAKAAPPRIAAAARSCVALLAGIPSVVYGLVGMTVLVPFVQKTFSLLRRVPAHGYSRADGDDPAVHRVRFGNGAARRTARI